MANLTSYGFVGLEHLAKERVSNVNIQVIDAAIQASVDEHNRVVDAALTELVERTVKPSARYKLPGGGTLQPADEWSTPTLTRDAGHYNVGFPIQGGQTAWGDNRISRALMTVAEADERTMNALLQDANWMRRHIIAAMLDNSSWVYADPDEGDVTVQPLANGDDVTYLRKSGTVATDSHYYAQAAAIGDAANPFDGWHTELNEHPENAGPYVAYIPTNLKASVEGLTNFKEVGDPNIRYGANTDQLVGRIDRGFGGEVLGYVNSVYVVEWELLPDNYGLVVARGARTKVLRMREYDSPTVQGFFRENHSPDGNLLERRFFRYAGFGAFNRVGALAFRIGNASYETPSTYSTPLAN